MINTRPQKLSFHHNIPGHPWDLVDRAEEHQVWFRRKVYTKVALFLVSSVCVGLVLLLFSS